MGTLHVYTDSENHLGKIASVSLLTIIWNSLFFQQS